MHFTLPVSNHARGRAFTLNGCAGVISRASCGALHAGRRCLRASALVTTAFTRIAGVRAPAMSLRPSARRHVSSSAFLAPPQLLGPRNIAAIESEVLSSIRMVEYAPIGDSLGTVPKMVNSVRVEATPGEPTTVTVRIRVAPPSPAASGLSALFEAICVAARSTPTLRSLAEAGVQLAVHVDRVPFPHARAAMTNAGAGLAAVGAVVAVYSAKGGVGKSTVAVNLAAALSLTGARVGILDADVAGPSLPTMVLPEGSGADGCNVSVARSSSTGRAIPVAYRGMACMSYGWLAPVDAATGARSGAPMRGPRAASIASALAGGTEWGALDVLVVDMPPGTGDIHITLGQVIPFAAAVIVTTPQRLSLVDVAKGCALFDALHVPPVALVLNMAYFDTPDGTRYFPFGDGAARLAESGLVAGHRIPKVLALPIEPVLSVAGDVGTPAVFQGLDAGSAAAVAFAELAAVVGNNLEARLLAELAPSAVARGGATDGEFAVHYDDARRRIVLRAFAAGGGTETVLHPRLVRSACRCAACIDEVSGVARPQAHAISDDVVPLRIRSQGNYAVAIAWSDGHASSVYGYDQLAKMTSAV